MTVRIGMIGPGGMGQAHIERIHTVIAGGRVVAVSDVDPARAAEVAERIGGTSYATSAELIESSDVDAVMICSYGPAHEVDVLACIAAGKPVLCEKPLTPTADAALRIMAAEQAAGRRLVTVGFMRRFDAGYRQMKALLDSGELGEHPHGALRPPQPHRPRPLHVGHGDQRHRDPRGRHDAMAARRGVRLRPGRHPAQVLAGG